MRFFSSLDSWNDRIAKGFASYERFTENWVVLTIIVITLFLAVLFL